MRYIAIDPKEKTIRAVDAKDFDEARKAAKLGDVGVDFGSLGPGLQIVVYEYGLLETGHGYFALGRNLYAGRALLFAHDLAGDTVDCPLEIPVIWSATTWMADEAAVEKEIAACRVDRPTIKQNGVVFDQWPFKKGGMLGLNA